MPKKRGDIFIFIFENHFLGDECKLIGASKCFFVFCNVLHVV